MKKLLLKGCFILCTAIIFSTSVAQNQESQSRLFASAAKTSTAVSAAKIAMPDLEDTYKNYFEKRKSAMYYLENLQTTTDFLFYAKKFGRKDFLEKKNEYRTKGGADAYVYDLISKQENFYTATVPTKTTEIVNAFLESQKDKKDYTKNSAKDALNAYNACLDYIEGMLLLNPESTYYSELKTKNELDKNELETYIASGKYEKSLKTRTAEQINAVQINPSKMQDIYAEWAVNESILYSNVGKTTVVSIVSKQWKIIKDNAGTPTYKYIDVEASVKGTDNKCYKVSGTVSKPYEKDSTYGKPLFKYQYIEEMNCENVSAAKK